MKDKLLLLTNYWQTGCTINALCISYNRGKRDLPDIYALAQGSHALGRGHIYQANPDCQCCYNSRTSNKLTKNFRAHKRIFVLGYKYIAI